ncbi:aKG-HExxH-type peptide beta-hydroxylase [Streptomyces sp. NPDC002144]
MTGPATLRMTAEDFASLAACRPSSAALRVLRDGQVSRRLLMLKSVADVAREGAPGFWASHASAAWDLCIRARRTDVRAFEDVLLHPHVGVWLGRCLRASDGPRPALGSDLARLGGLAAAAALRAGLRPHLALPAPESLLWLPTLGDVRLPPGVGEVNLRGDVLEWGGRSLVVMGERERMAHHDEWHAPRRLTARAPGAPPLTVVLEDGDPYRDAHGHPVDGRQTAQQLRVWQASLTSAWHVLNRLVPERAVACAELWTALVPLRPSWTGRGVSSSAREAYGAIAVSCTADPVRLAETVVHETTHIVHAGLADLVDLADPEDRTLHRVGWRRDARPVASVLTGTHAHLSMIDFWRRRRQELTGEQARRADARLHHYGRQVAAALGMLQLHPALTSVGARFVAIMVEEAARCGFPVHPRSSVLPQGASSVRVASWGTPYQLRRPAASAAVQGGAGLARRARCGAKTSDGTTPGAD